MDMRLRPCWFLTASNLNPNLIFRQREKKEGDFGRVFLFVWLMYYLYGQSLNHFIHQSSRFYVLTPRRLYVPGRAQVGHKFSVLKIKIERSVKWIKWKTPLRQKPDSCVWFFFSSTAAIKKISTEPQMRDILISLWNVCRRSITLSNLSQFFPS